MKRMDCYLEAYSGRGYGDCFDSLPSDGNYIFLNHADRAEFQRFAAGVLAENQSEKVWVVHDPVLADISGIIFLERRAGVVNISPFCRRYPTVKGNEQVLAYADSALQEFAAALAVHDRWEKVYIGNMDFEEMNRLTAEVSDRMIGNAVGNETILNRNFYFGADNIAHVADYIPAITAGLSRRYFIKGRPGSGKSTMMKKIMKAANAAGFDTWCFPCSFDTGSLDMVIIPSLSVCIFDSTPPHEHFPVRPGDEVVDVYGRCIAPGTDEEYAAELREIEAEYCACKERGHAWLKKAGAACATVPVQDRIDAGVLLR